MSETVLYGCRPEPLMSYLKALGILRVVTEQADPTVRSAWRDDSFVLGCDLSGDELESFFLERYEPTPIVGPWAGGCGFFKKDNKKAVTAIANSTTPRLRAYRGVIEQVRAILRDEGVQDKPSDEEKWALVTRYRRELPDRMVQWMDAVIALTGDRLAFPPIMGTGGNDGRLDFTRNFMERICDLGIPWYETEKEKIEPVSRRWLRSALFGETCDGLLTVSIGMFDPGGAGGANAGQGFEGKSWVNPWDFVLMLEGALVISGALVRRFDVQRESVASFPFTVEASQVGNAPSDVVDGSAARAEIWMPLWTRFASLAELRLLFAEGRAQLSGRRCRDGIEFARAAASLGVDRGLSGFVRYGFLKRLGKQYLAVSQGRFPVTSRRFTGLIEDLDRWGWLDRFRRACNASRPAPPSRFPSALRRLDSAIFDYCRYGGNTRFAAILRALGRIEKELALLPGKEIGGRQVNPVPLLSNGWIEASYDGSPEFRIALALSGISAARSGRGEAAGEGSRGPAVGPLRSNMESVTFAGYGFKWDENAKGVVWSGGDLSTNLLAVLRHRLMDADRSDLLDMPIDSPFTVGMDDIAFFLHGHTGDRLIEEYLWGLILVKRGSGGVPLGEEPPQAPPLPRSYALLKLIFLPGPSALRSGGDGDPVRWEPSILSLLAGGRLAPACDVAARRLSASGFVPIGTRLPAGLMRRLEFSDPVEPTRLAASLLIPVHHSAINKLKGLVIRHDDEASA